MITIHTYLCSKRLTAISVAGRPNSAISVSDGVVKAKIVPVGFNPKIKTVSPKIIKQTANLVDCIDPEPFLKWTRKALLTSNGDFAQLERLITIEGNIPDLPCFWEAAHIYGVTLSPANHRMLLASVPDRSGGEIPDSKSDVSRLGSDLTLRNTQTNIVPGEMLQLAWTIKVDDKVFSKPVAGAWFDTPAFTGGKLIEKTTNENTNSYMVSAIGSIWECLATDWAQYPVGSWVYILKQGGSQAEQCRRNSNFGSEDVDSFYFRLMPITVNDFGNEGGVFEKKSYSMMSASEFGLFFETSVHPGVILEVYTETDKARVNVQKLGPDRNQTIEFNQVPIFYHCEGSETVAGGSAAFAENDEVLVLNEGGGCSPSVDDLTVIGFKDEVKPCSVNVLEIKVSDFLTEYVTFFDLKTNTVPEIKIGDQTLTFPKSLASINTWYNDNVKGDPEDRVIAYTGASIGMDAEDLVPMGAAYWCGANCPFVGSTDSCEFNYVYPEGSIIGGNDAVSHLGNNINTEYGPSFKYNTVNCESGRSPKHIGSADGFISAVRNGKIDPYVDFGLCSFVVSSNYFPHRAIIAAIDAHRTVEGYYIGGSMGNIYTVSDFTYKVYSPFEAEPVHTKLFHQARAPDEITLRNKVVSAGSRRNKTHEIGFFVYQYRLRISNTSTGGYPEYVPVDGIPLVNCYSKEVADVVNPFTGLEKNNEMETAIKNLIDARSGELNPVTSVSFRFVNVKM